jgi:hypothetical protein
MFASRAFFGFLSASLYALFISFLGACESVFFFTQSLVSRWGAMVALVSRMKPFEGTHAQWTA